MSKFNLKILLAIVVGIIKVVVSVLSGDIDLPDDSVDSNGIS